MHLTQKSPTGRIIITKATLNKTVRADKKMERTAVKYETPSFKSIMVYYRNSKLFRKADDTGTDAGPVLTAGLTQPVKGLHHCIIILLPTDPVSDKLYNYYVCVCVCLFVCVCCVCVCVFCVCVCFVCVCVCVCVVKRKHPR